MFNFLTTMMTIFKKRPAKKKPLSFADNIDFKKKNSRKKISNRKQTASSANAEHRLTRKMKRRISRRSRKYNR